ncbi:MAG: DNA polymerase/3'-5' exonuclease PolX [Nitrospirae bacterium]|nr:DNA polymerase/3'-5' exonuclease PolX [Nitrospirota bacterium]
MNLKQEIIDLLELIGTYLELKGENPFKVRAFQNAARTISLLSGDLREMILAGTLKEEKGIGAALFETIHEFVTTGSSSVLQSLEVSIPSGLLEMKKIEGLGPKKIKAIHEKLGITTIGELEYACQENRLLTLEGFGRKSQDNILKGIENLKKGKEFFHFDQAWTEAEAVRKQLHATQLFDAIEIGGSLRRRREVIRNINLVSSSRQLERALVAFSQLSQVESIRSHEATRVSAVLKSGLGVELDVVSPENYPFALQYLTGSKEHNIRLQEIARKKGFLLSPNGLFKENLPVSCQSEKEIYSNLGLDPIPPELREDRGEFEAAGKRCLPRLVESDEIRGIFHLHTTRSDGRNTLEEMVNEAARAGYQYVGISDHSQSAFYAHGLKEEDIRQQHADIDRLQKTFPKIRIFKGIESDILEEGDLDYPEELLASFDFIIGSIHSRFKMTETEMTKRLLRAMDNPYLTILGHMTGRLLLSREAYSFDLDAVFQKAKEKNVIIELNANPHRLDIDWKDCKKLKEYGLQVSINPDAHAIEHIYFTGYGVGIARKGWLTSREVFNTLPLGEMEKMLASRRPVHG